MKESVKSFILVSLTGLLIVLIGTLWFEPVRGDEIPKNKTEGSPVVDVSYLIDISSVNVTDDDQIKTFFYDVGNLFNYLKPYIVNSMMNMNQAEEITAEQYYAKQSGRSVEFIMREDISTRAFLSVASNSDILFEPKDNAVRAIAINDERQFFFRSETAYYQLTQATLPSDCSARIASLDIKDAVVYNTIEKQLKIESSQSNPKRVLLPSAVVPAFAPIKVFADPILQKEQNILLIADKVFGSRINFVRRFFDVNGSVVMLYGYGERALKISPDGSVIVEQKIDTRKVAAPDVLKDFKSAYDVVQSYGDSEQKLYLRAVVSIEKESIAGYLFDFGYKVNDYDVIDLMGVSGVQVEVVGGQVVSYERNYKLFFSKVDNVESAQTLPILSIMNNQSNYDNILSDYTLAHPEFVNDEQAFVEILCSISTFKMVYLDGGDHLIPAYCLTLDNNEYYFDATDFSMIKASVN